MHHLCVVPRLSVVKHLAEVLPIKEPCVCTQAAHVSAHITRVRLPPHEGSHKRIIVPGEQGRDDAQTWLREARAVEHGTDEVQLHRTSRIRTVSVIQVVVCVDVRARGCEAEDLRTHTFSRYSKPVGKM